MDRFDEVNPDYVVELQAGVDMCSWRTAAGWRAPGSYDAH